MDENAWPDPHAARDIPEFLAAMRQIKAASNLSYRGLAEQAAAAGESLPISTLSSTLSRESMPSPEVVRALVRACGGSVGTAESWLAARARLAMAMASGPAVVAAGRAAEPVVPRAEPAASRAEPAAPQGGPGSSPRWRPGVLGLASIAVIGLVLVASWAFGPQGRSATSGGSGPSAAAYAAPSSTAPSAERDGRYRLRVAHSGLCVGEGPELLKGSERIVLGQHDCAVAKPAIILEPTAEGLFRIQLDHPTNGIGCATVDLGGRGPRLLISGSTCDPDRPDQRFRLEAVDTVRGGHLLRSASGPAYCIGVHQASKEPGMQLIQDRCTRGAHQVFTLDPRQR
ncbi:MAG: hypothetical protein K0R62_1063 [Nonomuraea muscovyensis]|nr:hypothetical protein [Nonomuraea muscovyensis]